MPTVLHSHSLQARVWKNYEAGLVRHKILQLLQDSENPHGLENLVGKLVTTPPVPLKSPSVGKNAEQREQHCSSKKNQVAIPPQHRWPAALLDTMNTCPAGQNRKLSRNPNTPRENSVSKTLHSDSAFLRSSHRNVPVGGTRQTLNPTKENSRAFTTCVMRIWILDNC